MATGKAMKNVTAAGARRRTLQAAPTPPKRKSGKRGNHDAGLAALLNVADFEAAAAKKMTRASFDYYAGGAEDERTLSRNRAAMDRWVLLHRVLVDVSRVDIATTILGEPVSMPSPSRRPRSTS